ncbi:MAG: sigma-70 family RNA polymerase sigma factor [Blastomonas sp.]
MSSPEKIDPEQQQALIERYRLPLYRFFQKRVSNPAEIEDLVQDLFCRLLSGDNADHIANPEAYIFQAAANLLRDRGRRAATRSAFEREFSQDGQNFVEELSPERVLMGRERLRVVQTALGDLPERTRTVFVLHRFELMKYQQIATRLGISVSSVEKHMMAAMRLLNKRMGRK